MFKIQKGWLCYRIKFQCIPFTLNILLFLFYVEMGSHYVGHACLKLPASSNPTASAFPKCWDYSHSHPDPLIHILSEPLQRSFKSSSLTFLVSNFITNSKLQKILVIFSLRYSVPVIEPCDPVLVWKIWLLSGLGTYYTIQLIVTDKSKYFLGLDNYIL